MHFGSLSFTKQFKIHTFFTAGAQKDNPTIKHIGRNVESLEKRTNPGKKTKVSTPTNPRKKPKTTKPSTWFPRLFPQLNWTFQEGWVSKQVLLVFDVKITPLYPPYRTGILWYYELMILWHCETMRLWDSENMRVWGHITLWDYEGMKLWSSVTMIVRYYDTVILSYHDYDRMIVWSYDTMTLWYKDPVILWSYDTLIL